MANKRRLHDISEGVTHDDFKKSVQDTFDSVVRPQLKAERKLRDTEKRINDHLTK